MRLFGKERPALLPSLVWQETPLLHWFLLGSTDSPTPFLLVSLIPSISFFCVIQLDFLPSHIPPFLVLSVIISSSLIAPLLNWDGDSPPSLGHPFPFHPSFQFLTAPSIFLHPSTLFLTSPPSPLTLHPPPPPAPPFPSSVAVVCVDGAAVRSGQKSRPGLLLLACPQWSVCCMCVCVCVCACVCLCVCVCVGVCWGLRESGHTGWPASSQPAVRVELGIWSLSIGPAGIFQRLLSPPLFNISLLLGVLAAEARLCCQHRPTL